MNLTLSWPGKILLHPKIRCFNFKPQYLLNYTSPTNDLYSVRKRSIGAFKSIFKLLALGPASAGPLRAVFCAKFSAGVRLRRTGSELCAKTLHASCLCLLFSMFQNMLGTLWPNVDTSGIKGAQTKTGKTENLHLFFFWFFRVIFWVLETSRQFSVKRRRMLCNIVWNSY